MSLVDKAIAATGSQFLIDEKANTKFVRKLDVEGTRIDRPTLKFLVQETTDTNAAYAHNLEFLYALSRNKVAAEFKSLDDCAAAIWTYLNTNRIKGYIFTREDNGIIYPWLVTKVGPDNSSYRHDTEARVEITAYASTVTSNKAIPYSIILDAYALRRIFDKLEIDYDEKWKHDKDSSYLLNVTAKEKVKVHDLFEELKIYKESPDLFDIYEKHLVRFKAFLPRYGQQFIVRGTADTQDTSGWYATTSSIDLSVDGSPGRCIMTTVPAACRIQSESDTIQGRRPGYGTARRRVSTVDRRYESNFLVNVDDLDISLTDLEIQDAQVNVKVYLNGNSVKDQDTEEPAPLHPVLDVFHLTHHSVFQVHAANMAPYKYKDNIKENLILPEEVKELSEMLVSTGDEDNEDVIENKSKATIIACIGDPGLGKTLMAEVISEECKKPLYKIQAAQLGMTHEELENNLAGILHRAEAWNCVLMIDEANAYIHKRGHDIRQNAIVGVFLRLLEYYKGTLILTTNHSDDHGGIDIDDAIISRCSAVFTFKLPTLQDASKIWKLQAKLLKVKLSFSLLEDLSHKFNLSGRSIRNLLRLTNRWATRKGISHGDLTIKHFETCARFIPTTQSEGKVSSPKI